MMRALKWLGIAILIPILLFCLLAVLLYLPPVQNWAVKRVAAIASEKTGMEISVEHVNLEFPLNLGVEGVRVIKPRSDASGGNALQKDTVADIRKMVVDVQLKPLFKGQVEVDKLDLEGVKVNTTDFISDTQVKGTFGKLSLESHGIDLKGENLRVNTAQLEDANVDVILSDTAAVDTTASTNKWKILVDDLNIKRSDVRVHLPGDTLQVTAHLGDTKARNGSFDFGKGDYRLGQFEWKDGRFKYDDRSQPQQAEGMDYSHLSLNEINIALDSVSFNDEGLLLRVKEAAMKEKSGMELRELSGGLAIEREKEGGALSRLRVNDLRARTSESSIDGRLVMDLNTFDDENPGKLHATVDATIGKQDIVRAAGALPQQFKRKWPNQPLTVKGVVSGNMRQAKFDGLHVKLPGALNMHASGYVTHPTDLDHMIADVDLEAKADNMDFLTALLPKDALGDVRIPKGIGVKGKVKANGQHYQANLVATEGGGSVKADVDLDAKRMNYTAQLQANRLNPKHFLPSLDAGPFTGTISLKGSGTDFLSPRTSLQAKADVKQFSYAGYNLDGMKGTANINNGRIRANVDSKNKLLNGVVQVDGLTRTKTLQGTISADIAHADLYKLGLVDRPLTVSSCLHVDVASNLKDYYKVQGLVSDITIRDSANVYRPDDVVLDVLTRRDTTHAVLDCGDFHLRADAGGGYEQLLKQVDRLVSRVTEDVKGGKIDQQVFRKNLPTANIYLNTGNTNFFAKLLERQGFSFQDADVDLRISPITGVNGNLIVNRLMADSIQLDTVRLYVESDSTNITYHGQIQNNKNNPQYVFNALFDGYLLENGTGVNLQLYDEKNRLGAKLGAVAEMVDSGIVARLNTEDPILGYKTFKVNEDNYVFLAKNQRISAKLNLQAADGQGLQIYTNDENLDAQQDITASLHRFDLEQVLSVVPYAPDITGIMNGDFHLLKNDKDLSVSSSLSVDNLTLERSPMGNLSSEFVYIPKGDGTHYVDGLLYKDQDEVGTIVGTYDPKGKGHLDATLSLNHMPLSLINGFIPDQIVGFQGYADGDLSVKGELSKPQVNGEVDIDSCYLVSEPYGVALRFSNEPVRVVGSHLTLKDYELYAYNKNPLKLNGSVDFSDLDHINLNLRMSGNNVQIINAKETPKSIAFGKGFVNMFGVLQGEVDRLRMRGRVEVLPTSDMSYVLRDSPLTTDNQLDELVKFTDFTDTTAVVITRPAPSGFNMEMTVDVSNGTHLMAYLNADHSNYVDIMGGGTLRMQYDNVDDLQLRGKLTLSSGKMKYSLPVIPLKTFTIKDGSYIEFTGDPYNPRLDITATETVKAPVSNDQGIGQSKTFECGVVVTQTLQKMGVKFFLDAEDQQIQEELNTMGPEQRGKLAVSLLATGMYMADGNTNSFSMNSALSAFLNSQINDITGRALRTVDLSVGFDNAMDATGHSYMDYSFKFAKRFWNNRLKVSVGAKVSTGSEISDQNQSFFDNFDMEYRLDDKASKYITGFFKNNVYDWLDGYTQKYGVGFTWRRKLQTLGDLFRFKDDSSMLSPVSRTPRSENQNVPDSLDNQKKTE
ncbi:MAG: translocation/assembly module TamB domain-containing protein [Prevotella sp.]|nr:translocation/assembly module TamB domain-containing protein [Prevotella sp.]